MNVIFSDGGSTQKLKIGLILVTLLSSLMGFIIIADAGRCVQEANGILNCNYPEKKGTIPKIVDVTFIPSNIGYYWGESDSIPKEFEVGSVKVDVQNIGDDSFEAITVNIKGSKFKYYPESNFQPYNKQVPPNQVVTFTYYVHLDAYDNQAGQLITENPTIIARNFAYGSPNSYESTMELSGVQFKVPIKQQPRTPGFQLIYTILGIILVAFFLRKRGIQ